jgi:hypothetical protein
LVLIIFTAADSMAGDFTAGAIGRIGRDELPLIVLVLVV